MMYMYARMSMKQYFLNFIFLFVTGFHQNAQAIDFVHIYVFH